MDLPDNIRIDELPPFDAASNEHLLPVMLADETGRISIGQLLALAIDGAPEPLNTLAKHAAAIGNDENFADTVAAAILGAKERANHNGTQSATTISGGLLDGTVVPSTLPADKAFRRGNILGVVGQTGGVPTGAIIERGSNANGEYVRFADGTQICTLHTTITQAISTTYGAIFIGNSSWTFPAAFATAPAGGVLRAIIGGGAAWGSSSNVSTGTSMNMYFYDAVSRSSGSLAITYLAIGRWF